MQGYSASFIAPGSLGCKAKNPIRPVHGGFIYNPAHPGNLAPVGFLTSFFYVFVAKLGILETMTCSLGEGEEDSGKL